MRVEELPKATTLPAADVATAGDSEYLPLQEVLKVSPGKKAACAGTPSGSRAASADGPRPKKSRAEKEKEKEKEATDVIKRSALRLQAGEGYTPDNLQALAEHEAYIDCHIATGTVRETDKADFMPGLKATIEADEGEDARQQRLTTEHTSLVAAAAAKKTAIEQHAMAEAIGKGDGKGMGSKGFPTRISPIKYAPCRKSEREGASIANIVAAGISAAKAQES